METFALGKIEITSAIGLNGVSLGPLAPETTNFRLLPAGAILRPLGGSPAPLGG
jgi:hypothetical protein